MRQWQRENAERLKAYQAEYRQRPERLGSMHLDHDHDTGQLRGFLCVSCNQGLGQFREDPALLLRAVVYLRQWESPEGLTG